MDILNSSLPVGSIAVCKLPNVGWRAGWNQLHMRRRNGLHHPIRQSRDKRQAGSGSSRGGCEAQVKAFVGESLRRLHRHGELGISEMPLRRREHYIAKRVEFKKKINTQLFLMAPSQTFFCWAMPTYLPASTASPSDLCANCGGQDSVYLYFYFYFYFYHLTASIKFRSCESIRVISSQKMHLQRFSHTSLACQAPARPNEGCNVEAGEEHIPTSSTRWSRDEVTTTINVAPRLRTVDLWPPLRSLSH